MPQFGKARLWRSDMGTAERLYYRLFGLADPGHFIRSKYFERYLEGLTPFHILDAGCGAGDYAFYMAERFPHARVKGIDGDASIIERNLHTRDRMNIKNLDFEVRDLRTINETEVYDLILCVESLQYVQRLEAVIASLAGALKSKGSLFLHLPLLRYRPVPLHRHLRDFHEDEVVATRTRDEIHKMMRDAKLTVELSQYTFAYYAGELACSLFCLFYKDTSLNRLLQALVSPWARMLAWVELQVCWSNGFALALQARKLD